jgi:hypothetical protein
MNSKTIALVLIALGIVVLAYSGITYTTTQSHFIPPVAGALMLAGGIVLLVVSPQRA